MQSFNFVNLSFSAFLLYLYYITHFLEARDHSHEGGVQIIYAINAGGDRHTDIYGITYQKDPSGDGVASDFGMRTNIDRVHPNDEILYQTERYSPDNFGYDIPVLDDGDYVLVLKFSEVYFRMPGQKIFNVVLNNHHVVVENLDIFNTVGYATAHDEYVPFIVTDHGKKLIVGKKSSTIRRSRIRLDFVKGGADNPKVNAFYIAKGSIEDIPKLPPPHQMMEHEEDDVDDSEDDLLYGEDEEDIQFSRSDLGYETERARSLLSKRRPGSNRIDVRSGPVSDDPWDDEPAHVVYFPLILSSAASVITYYFLKFVNENF